MTTKRSSTQIVLEAIQDLHAQEQIVTRETLRDVTGLKLQIIDDRIGALIEDELVVRVQRGVFVPAATHPPARLMSKTVLPDGTVKIDIGDTVLTLTPREDRNLAVLQAGVVMQAASIEIGRHSTLIAGEMQGRLNRVERSLAKIDCITDVTSQGVTAVTGRASRELHENGRFISDVEALTPGAKRTRAYRARKKAAAEAGGVTSRVTNERHGDAV